MIGIFGGTFDPVHFGHLRSAWEVRERLRVHDFRMLPAGHPPHRNGPVTPARHRLEMLHLATRSLPGVSVDEREIHRSGPSWMVDTLEDIRSEADSRPLLLIIGHDSAAELDQWHQWERLIELAHIVVMRRPGAFAGLSPALQAFYSAHRAGGPESLSESPHGSVWEVEVTQLAISSSSIRELVRAGRSPRFLLPEPVLEYIGKEGLYR